MPGTFLTIKSKAGHNFQINNTTAKIKSVLKRLDKLHCNNCGAVDYKGRTVDVCTHVICRQCSSESPELLKDLKDRCYRCFDAVTENRLHPFKRGNRNYLEHLKVCCTQPGCPKQDILKRMDSHMETEHTEHQLLGSEVLSPLNPDESGDDQPLVISINIGNI